MPRPALFVFGVRFRGVGFVDSLLLVQHGHPFVCYFGRVSGQIDRLVGDVFAFVQENRFHSLRGGAQFEAMAPRFQAKRGVDPRQVHFQAAGASGEGGFPHQILRVGLALQALGPWPYR